MLELSNISHEYPGGRRVLQNVSLAPRPGRITAVLGPNGSGKSTLLRIAAGLLTPAEGTAMLDDRPVDRADPRQRARRLTYLAQRGSVAFGYTVRAVVAFGTLTQRPDAAARTDAALEQVGLLDRAAEPFATLSGGQQQRAMLARALAQLGNQLSAQSDDQPNDQPEPSILIADEPTAALDPKHVAQTARLLRSLADRRHAVLIAVHDLRFAAHTAHDALLLDQRGHAAASGPISDVLTPDRLEVVFQIPFGPPASDPVAPVPDLSA
ncbi:MAG: ABC transporter ATP-binding protein [Planctomycetota bacterium]